MIVEFEPQTGKQEIFLGDTADEILYGGSAFCGKSLCGIHKIARQCEHPRYRAMCFRREYGQLYELIDYAHQYWPHLYGASGKNEGRDWVFPSGAEIQLRHMEHRDDWRKYVGRNVTSLFFDELCMFHEDQYTNMLIWCRVTAPGLKRQIISTTNPWPDPNGDPLDWMMDRWNIPSGVRIPTSIRTVVDMGGTSIERLFIPATYRDNKLGVDMNPVWLAEMQGMKDEGKRDAFLDGVWGVSPGAFFKSFNERVHVLDPEDIEDRLNKGVVQSAIGYDHGTIEPAAGLWGSRDIEDNIYIWNEYYGAGPIEKHCMELKSRTPDPLWPLMVAPDPSVYIRAQLNTFIDREIAHEYTIRGIKLLPRDQAWPLRDQTQGYRVIHDSLFYEDGPPKLFISSKCKQLTHDLLYAQADEDYPDKLKDDGKYHIIAALRYLLMYIGRPSRRKDAPDLSQSPKYRRQQMQRKGKYARQGGYVF